MKIILRWWFAIILGLRRILFAMAVLTLPLIAHAGDMGLAIRHLEVRATAGGMTATGGYAHLENHGLSDVRLVAIEVAFAPKAEIHTMINVDGVMKMRPIEGGIVVPAGGHAILEPGGDHLMFMGLSTPLKPETTQTITFIFEDGMRIDALATVKKPADIGKDMHDHSHATHGMSHDSTMGMGGDQ